MNLVNLTPHPIDLFTPEGERITIPTSGTVTRVATTPGTLRSIEGVPVPVADPPTYGQVEVLPRPVEGTMYIVSSMVASALETQGIRRDDLLVPGTGPSDGVVRDAEGRIVGVSRLVRTQQPMVLVRAGT